MMTNIEAIEVAKEMIAKHKVHIEYLTGRLVYLRLEQERDPWDGNATQILRFETRIENTTRELEALTFLVYGFDGDEN
jgi:hypothetical protein